MLKLPPGQEILMMVDVTDSVLTPRITTCNKEVEQKSLERGIPPSPTALVGLSGFKLAVAQAPSAFRPNLHIASSREEAEEWLLKQRAAR